MMHSELLRRLFDIAEVRLVASLRDDRLGFPDPNDLRVFIPDLHLISEKRRVDGGFRFAANHPDLLTEVFRELRRLKLNAGDNQTVAVYVLGDFLDLWREAPGLDLDEDLAARIRDDHEDLIAAVLDRKLKTRFLLGNHDFDLYRWRDYQAWERRYYLPDRALDAPRVLLLHGDVFDWIESFPDQIQQLLVYLFAPHLSPNSHDLDTLAKFARRAHRNRKYRDFIQAPAPLELAEVEVLTDVDVPPEWNVARPDRASPDRLKHLDAARKEVQRRNQQYGMDLRSVVIGHTHYARVAVHEDDAGGFFALIDCGAWIEESSWRENGQTISAPSAQVGVLSGNEVRIYQLAPL